MKRSLIYKLEKLVSDLECYQNLTDNESQHFRDRIAKAKSALLDALSAAERGGKY